MGGSGAAEGAAAFARDHGHYFLDDASDPLVPAGTATIAAEIFDEIPKPDVVFVPMGDTALIRGVAAEEKRSVAVRTFASSVFRRSRRQPMCDHGGKGESSSPMNATRLLMV
jgi:threonine dehydratase